MLKKIVLAATALLMVSAVSAVNPVSNFQVVKNFESDFVAGETVSAVVEFDNTASENVSIQVLFNISSASGDTMTGEEFGVYGELNSTNSTGAASPVLGCQAINYTVQELSYNCTSTSIASSSNRLAIFARSNPALVPGDYDFVAKFYSEGVPAGSVPSGDEDDGNGGNGNGGNGGASTTSDGGSGSGEPIFIGSTTETGEEEDNETDTGSRTPINQTGEEDGGLVNETEPETDTEDNRTEEEPPETSTAGFFQSPSNWIWLLLLVVVTAIYYYRDELRERIEAFET